MILTGTPETFSTQQPPAGRRSPPPPSPGRSPLRWSEGDTGVEAWDRVREHTYVVDYSELRAIDVWNRPER